VTILLSNSLEGGSVAGPSSLQDQRPFIFFLKVFWFIGSGWRHHQGGHGGGAGFIVGAVFPEGQQEHGEFAGDGDDGALLFAGAAGAGQALAVFAQGAGRAEGAEDVMRGADEQPAHQGVTAFADAQLFVRAAALVAARAQTQIRPDITAAIKAGGVANLEHEAQRGERTDAGDLLEALGDGIIRAAALHQVALHAFDLFRHLRQHGEQRLHHRETIGGHVSQYRFVKRLARRVAHGITEALEGEAHGIDEVDTGADEGITEFEAQEIMLGLGRAVLDGVQQRGINPREASEHLGVPLVALAFVAGDGVELARVGDEHGGTAPGEEPADPRAVGARFDRNRGARELGHQLRQCRSGVGQRALADDLAGGIQDADMMTPVTEIEAEGEPAGNDRGGRE